MNKNLLKKIGVVALVSGLAFFSDFRLKYEIDGNKVKYERTSGNIVEYKGRDKVKYYQTFFKEDLRKVVVNGDSYKYEKSPAYKEAQIRYDDLLDKIDSLRTVDYEAKIQRKIDQEKEREAMNRAKLKRKLDERSAREKKAVEIIKK